MVVINIDLRNTAYWKIFEDVFRFLKEALPVQKSEEYWSLTLQSMEVIYLKYRNSEHEEFVRGLLLCVGNELERVYRT